MSAQNGLTPEQVERIELAVSTLAMGSNAFCQAIQKSLQGKQPDEKRRILAGTFAQLYEAMMGFQSALDSSRTPDQIRLSLAAKGRRR